MHSRYGFEYLELYQAKYRAQTFQLGDEKSGSSDI
jgi:hypothetical protein|tara:strand:- start:17 stop:121 length:105 start_codon:yes stop_codon:yes gene_type:complete